MRTAVGLVDDDKLFARSLSGLIDTFPSFKSSFCEYDGEDLLRQLGTATELPAILIIDVNMKRMGGIATASAVAEKYPQIKMVALSMNDDDMTVLSMIKAGCRAYLVKDISPEELESALGEVNAKGHYNGDRYHTNYSRIHKEEKALSTLRISDREKTFLQLASSDLTYRQIASEMGLSERTIDGYRESLFEKLKVQSRVGMVLEALKKKLIRLA